MTIAVTGGGHRTRRPSATKPFPRQACSCFLLDRRPRRRRIPTPPAHRPNCPARRRQRPRPALVRPSCSGNSFSRQQPSMFLSKRERPSDTPSASTSPSHIAYKRTSIPSINVVSLFASASSAGSSAQRRAPLAPLDPQLASTSSLDDQMAPASAHTTSRSDRSQRLDSSRDGDVPRTNVGRQIMAWPLEDDESNIPSLRKRSIPNQYVSCPRSHRLLASIIADPK